jgi:RHS repeat-associated protein
LGARQQVNITYYGTTDTSGCATGIGNCYRRGDRNQITNALGQSIAFLRYDAAGRATKVRDANNVVAEMTYHPRGWLTQQILRGANDTVTTDDQITDYVVDARGNLTKLTTPDGNFVDMTYDNRNRLTKVRDQAGNELRYTYDSAGNRQTAEAWVTSPSSVKKRSQSFTVDLLDRLTQAQGSTVDQLTAIVYDAAGRQTKITTTIDPSNNVQTTQSYDDLDRLIGMVADSAVGGLQSTTQMTYDAIGNLRSVIDPKALTTSYTYDALGRLTQQISPDSGTSSYTYDDAGNQKTMTDARSITATYGYDALNRLTTVVYPTTAENVTYLYDAVNTICTVDENFPLGRLSKMTDQSGTTEYCYDRFGNTTRKVQTTGTQVFVVRYSYNKSNQLASMTTPDGTLVDYVRDTQARVQEVGVTVTGGTRQVLVGNTAYLPGGPASSWQYGTTRTLTRNYDLDYRSTGVRDPGAGGLDIGYVYDSASYLKQITTQSTTTTRANFDYDKLGRMLARKDAVNVIQESYTYDKTGNRLATTIGATTTTNTYPATNHRLTQVGAVARVYDNAGNLTSIGGTTKEFVYNNANRMSVAKANSIVQGTYVYNGYGEQVQRQTSTTTRFVYDESGQLIGQYESTGTAIQQYIAMNGIPVGMIVSPAQATTANGRLKYVEPDQLGTPRAIIDPTRQVAIWRWDENSEGFGDTAPNTDPDADGTQVVFDLRFSGQRYDQASGLYYNGYRDFEPATGRYTQSDPIGLVGGISTYMYVGGNSLTNIDPSGLYTVITRFRDISGESFSENMKRRKEFINSPVGRAEARLTALRENFQEQINKKCAADKKVIQPIFDQWQVQVDDSMNSPTPISDDFAVTLYQQRTTTFYRPSFLEGTSLYFVAAHELRHLFKVNHELLLPKKEAYGRAFALGRDLSQFPHEKDADSWALKFLNTNCGCYK